MFKTPPLTRSRIWVALGIALAADGLQVLTAPLAWAFLPEIIDVIAMGLVSLTLGFHLLFLPTFVVEFVPVVDMLPTWTGCVLAVIALRKRVESPHRAAPPVIEVSPAETPPASLTEKSADQGTRPR